MPYRSTKCPEPLCLFEVLPLAAYSLSHTSAGVTPPSLLLRTHAPDQNPPIVLVVPYTTGLCRLLPAPAGSWPFPALSLQIFHWMLGPLPRRFLWCTYPFLPIGHRPSPHWDKVGTLLHPVQRLQYGSQFRGCRHLLMFRPPGLLATQVVPTAMPLRPYGSRDFYVRAEHELLPSRASDMLAARIG